MKKFFTPNTKGMTLVEVMIVTGLMVTTALVMMTITSNQLKANSFLEFQLRREQLRMVLIGQFLGNSNNCKCLFNGAATFPTTGTTALTGVTPTAIGPYKFVTPGDCSTATIPSPFITTTGADGLVANSIGLTDIVDLGGGTYQGNLTVAVSPTREVLGPTALKPIVIPVSVQATPSGSDMAFQSCTATAGGGGGGTRCRLALETFDNDTCSGNTMTRYSDWSDTSTAVIWTSRDSLGNFIPNYSGRNRNPGDIACMRIGIQCQ